MSLKKRVAVVTGGRGSRQGKSPSAQLIIIITKHWGIGHLTSAGRRPVGSLEKPVVGTESNEFPAGTKTSSPFMAVMSSIGFGWPFYMARPSLECRFCLRHSHDGRLYFHASFVLCSSGHTHKVTDLPMSSRVHLKGSPMAYRSPDEWIGSY